MNSVVRKTGTFVLKSFLFQFRIIISTEWLAVKNNDTNSFYIIYHRVSRDYDKIKKKDEVLWSISVFLNNSTKMFKIVDCKIETRWGFIKLISAVFKLLRKIMFCRRYRILIIHQQKLRLWFILAYWTFYKIINNLI